MKQFLFCFVLFLSCLCEIGHSSVLFVLENGANFYGVGNDSPIAFFTRFNIYNQLYDSKFGLGFGSELEIFKTSKYTAYCPAIYSFFWVYPFYWSQIGVFSRLELGYGVRFFNLSGENSSSDIWQVSFYKAIFPMFFSINKNINKNFILGIKFGWYYTTSPYLLKIFLSNPQNTEELSFFQGYFIPKDAYAFMINDRFVFSISVQF